jgi:hypothetical protein
MGLLSKAITVNPPVPRPKEDTPRVSPVLPSAPPGDTKPVREALERYWLQNSSFQGIILGLPKYAGEGKEKKFFDMVTLMVASFGYTVSLPAKSILILFSKTRDRELLTHRLVKTLRTRALVSFEAESPEDALSRIRSCL